MANEQHPNASLLTQKMSYTDFFKSRTELVKAYCDTAKSYIQISSAALALPLLFRQAWLGEAGIRGGLQSIGVPWSLIMAWLSFLLAIACGLAYQWLIVRRLWDKLNDDHLTPDNAKEWGVAPAPGVPKFESLDRSYLYGGMVFCFYLGACLFVWFSWTVLATNP